MINKKFKGTLPQNIYMFAGILTLYCVSLCLSWVIHNNHIPYLLLSIILLCFVYYFSFDAFINVVHNRKAVLIRTLVSGSVIILIYVLIVNNRVYEYVSDHAVFFYNQRDLLRLFNELPLKGTYAIIASIWHSDYSYFINILLGFPFFFTNGTNDAFVITYCIFFIVPTCLSMNILLDFYQEKYCSFSNEIFGILSNFLFITFPLLHFASLLGMPDIFGLYFIFLLTIRLLSIDYSFTRTPVDECLKISLLIICSIITRRWYVFSLMGLLPGIVLFQFIDYSRWGLINIKVILANMIKVWGIIFGSLLIILSPFVYHTLFVRNYSVEYAAWYEGGASYEFLNQAGFLGIIMCLLIIFGMFWGLYKRNLRMLTAACIVGYFITLFAFTSIQNMGKHQSLSLMIFYLLFLWNVIAAITDSKIGAKKSFICILLFSCILIWNDISTFLPGAHISGIHLATNYKLIHHFQWK